jgi:hypothetical protein
MWQQSLYIVMVHDRTGQTAPDEHPFVTNNLDKALEMMNGALADHDLGAGDVALYVAAFVPHETVSRRVVRVDPQVLKEVKEHGARIPSDAERQSIDMLHQ